MSTWDDIADDAARDMAISDLHDEAVVARATREQAIFVFVEGQSEEVALPVLFTDILDMDAIGVKIANYNGRGNLCAALRLLKLTLSYDRPVIVTYDNDPESVASIEKCRKQGLLGGLTHPFPIPCEPIVTYECGHVGGSFEESFHVNTFLNAAFCKDILPPGVMRHRKEFESQFDPHRPWLRQLQKYSADLPYGWWAREPLTEGCLFPRS
jgi:hypothetical protein